MTSIIRVRYIHIVVGLLFTLFAIVQWNDADALLWIVMYAIVATVAFLKSYGRSYRIVNLVITLVMIAGLISYLPEVSRWVKDGMPSITTSMKASTPYIELVREFFGLLISTIAMGFYLVSSNK
jgi:hypothetical protein